MIDLLSSVLLLAGGGFSLLAAIGLVRMPDVLTRMQTATKGVTFGCGLLLLAVALHFEGLGTTTRALAGIVFLLITSPVAAHVIGRAAYLDVEDSPLWEGSVLDQARPLYDRTHRVLRGLGETREPDPSAAERSS
jgi:multicomponent Na+:H+ antiporter subunit G